MYKRQMKSGVLYGNVALIDGMLAKIEEEMGQKLTIIATGGLAKACLLYTSGRRER